MSENALAILMQLLPLLILCLPPAVGLAIGLPLYFRNRRRHGPRGRYCPFCGEFHDAQAQVCLRCGRAFPQEGRLP